VVSRPCIQAEGRNDFSGIGCSVLILCNQIRSHGVRFGKRAVVGAVRVFESYLGLRFCFLATDHTDNTDLNV
jgi:hypothetical protein